MISGKIPITFPCAANIREKTQHTHTHIIRPLFPALLLHPALMHCQAVKPACSAEEIPCTNANCPHKHHSSLLCDALGPFPDEVIMAVLDRILYFSGVTKIWHHFDLVTMSFTGAAKLAAEPPALPAITKCHKACSTSCVDSVDNISKCSSQSSQSKYATPKSKHISCCTLKSTSIKSKCSSSKTPPGCTPRLRSPRVDFANPVADTRALGGAGGHSLTDRMKQSLTTCSIACHRLKSRLAARSDQRWVWTRLVRSEDGCKIYEVYHNSSMSQKSRGSKQPDIVFLVMPTGQVMPFESVQPDAQTMNAK
ncbi:hypothetical protein KR222_005067 [Zaprionus bogoriensis]|nr:hypothetical protein KR222_005067 [Zaprionus bogoriensis]